MESKSGSYSQHYKQFEQEHLDTLRQAHQSGRHEALLRSKKLQHETNKRRKAQAIKRKLEAQREEKRRQEILVKRKQEIQEATERFQRLNKTYSKDEQEDKVFHPSQVTPGLEDALHAVRGSSAGPRRPVRQSSAGTRIHSATTAAHHQGLARQDSNSSVHGSHSATNVREGGTMGEEVRSGSAGRRRRPESAKSLHDRSLRNLTNSRSLFEQQLEQHQQLLMDQQQQSLFQFNEAILMEMEQDKKLRGEEEDGMGDASVLRTESLSSVDSLEEGKVEKENGANEIPNGSGAGNSTGSYGSDNVSNLMAKSSSSPVTSSSVNSANSAGFVLHRSSSGSSSNVAIVQPMTSANHQEPPKNYESKPFRQEESHFEQTHQYQHNGYQQNRNVVPSKQEMGTPSVNSHQTNHDLQLEDVSPDPADGSMKERGVYGTIQTRSNGRYNGQYYQDSVVNFVAEAGPSSDNLFYANENDIRNGYNHQNYAENDVKSDPYQINKAWTSQPSGVIHPPASDYENAAHHHQANLVTNSKPYSSRTTATNVTLTTGYTHATQTNTHTVSSAKPETNFYTNSAGLYNHFGLDQSNFSPADPYMSSMFTTGIEQACSTSTATSTIPSQSDRHTVSPPKQQAPTTQALYATTSQPISSSSINSNHVSSQYLSSTAISSSKYPIASTIRSQATTTTTMSSQQPATSSHVTTAPVWNKPAASGKPAIPTIHDEAPRDDESESSEEEKEEPKEKELKGILKKPGHGEVPKKSVRIGGIIGQGANRHVKTNQSIIRDSLEVSRDHLHGKKPEQKKENNGRRVRFWDMVYEDEEVEEEDEGESEEEEKKVISKPPEPQTKIQPEPPSKPKTTQRPVSAKVVSHRPPTTTSNTRVQSAGPTRRPPAMRPHPPSQPPSGRAAMATANQQPARGTGTSTQPTTTSVTPTSKPTVSKIPTPVATTKVQPKSSDNSPNYNHGGQKPPQQQLQQSAPFRNSVLLDSNGMRLDRTPTDDEINWLWDKVRTCLHRENTGEQEEEPPQARQAAPMNTKYFDGNNIASPYRVAPRNAVATSNYNSNNYGNTVAGGLDNHNGSKKKVTMDTLNTYSRRAALLQQRKAPATNSTHANTVHNQTPPMANVVHTTVHSLPGYQPPIQSTTQPAAANASYYTPHQHEPVSESLAGFLAAEQLAGHSASESELEHAMTDAQLRQHTLNSTRPQQKVPSALSIEEQRLISSLERLNERLKVQEAGMTNSPGVFVPRPPAATVHHSGFRGHNPKQNQRRQISTNGTVTRHSFARVPPRAGTMQARNHKTALRYR